MDVKYLGITTVSMDKVSTVVEMVKEINANEPPGDILVFMAGQEEIENVCQILNEHSQNAETGEKSQSTKSSQSSDKSLVVEKSKMLKEKSENPEKPSTISKLKVYPAFSALFINWKIDYPNFQQEILGENKTLHLFYYLCRFSESDLLLHLKN